MDSRTFRLIAYACFLVALIRLALDVADVTTGIISEARSIPFVLPVVYVALGIIFLKTIGASDRLRAQRQEAEDDSYFNPRHHPRGRIDPPDGTTD